MKTIIYLIFEIETLAPLYVGKTIGFENRIASHKRKYVRKHGLDIDGLILEIVYDDWEICERKWISSFRQICRLDNILSGGQDLERRFQKLGGSSSKGKKNYALSISKKGKPSKLKGRKYSDEEKSRIYKSRIGIKNPKASAAKSGRSQKKSDTRSLTIKNYWQEIRRIQKEMNCSFLEARRIRGDHAGI